MSSSFATKVFAGAVLLGGLAGCAAQTAPIATHVAATPTPVVTQDPRWIEPDATEPNLDDDFKGAQITVDPDGTAGKAGGLAEHSATNPDYPAPIASDGIIYVEMTFYGGEVSRIVRDSYISADKEGAEKGPAITCDTTPNSVPQAFKCWARFKDASYKSGNYFAVLITVPAQNSDQGYGTKKVTVPFFTKSFT